MAIKTFINTVEAHTFNMNSTRLDEAYMNSVIVYKRMLELTLDQQQDTFNLRTYINSKNTLNATEITVINNRTQPSMVTGNLYGLNVTFINNGEIQGTNPGDTALTLTSKLKFINDGWIRGSGGKGGKGGIGGKGLDSSSSSTTTTRVYDYPGRWWITDEVITCFIKGEFCKWRYITTYITTNPPYGSLVSAAQVSLTVGPDWTGPTVFDGATWERGNLRQTNPIEPNLCNYGGGRQWIYDLLKTVTTTISRVGGSGGEGGEGGIGQSFRNAAENGDTGIDGNGSSPAGGNSGGKGGTGGTGGTWGNVGDKGGTGSQGAGSGAAGVAGVDGSGAGNAIIGWGVNAISGSLIKNKNGLVA